MEKGGRTKRISEEYLGLKNLGHQVALVTFSSPPSWVMDHYEESDKWIVINKNSARLDLILFWNLFKLVIDFKPDVIDAHCESSSLYAALVGKLTNTKCVATVHRSKLHYYENNWKRRLYNRYLDGFIAVSDERKTRMSSQLGLPEEKIKVIHWGIDPDIVTGETDQVSARSRLGLPNGKIILSLGHLGEIKGHEESIKAVAAMHRLEPGVRLYIGGDGSQADYDRLNALIEELNVQEAVILLGQITNVIEWLHACDVFLQPSREEAFGLVFIEAGLCKRPTIATKVGGIPEIIADGETGYLVDVNSPQQIEEKLTELFSSPEKCSRMGQAAYDRVVDNFILTKQISALADHFKSISKSS